MVEPNEYQLRKEKESQERKRKTRIKRLEEEMFRAEEKKLHTLLELDEKE